MMKSIHLLLLSVFLIPLMQTAYSQSSMNQSGGPIVNLPAGTDNPVNKPGDRLGLIEDTPNYNKYIPNTGPSSDNALVGPAQPSNGAAGGGGSTSSSSSSSSNTPTSGNASNGAAGGGSGSTSSSSSSNTSTSGNASNGAAGGGSTSSSSSPSNASNPIGGALENTTKTISETIGKGISGILNLGNSSSK
jgi:hypothetical protein